VIVECFTPTEAEASAARELLDALAHANSTEHGVVVLPSGQFVDRAMIKGAERVIALAARRSHAT
jgi:citrate lyase subunit beta/citryl-CoA lyase